MKRLSIILSLLLIVLLLPGCSSKQSLDPKPSFELVDSSVTITNDRAIAGAIGITEGEKKGQELVPTVLYYKFRLKNDGLTAITKNQIESLELRLEPSEKLKDISQEIVGFNIFDPESYTGSGLGYGYSFDLYLKPGNEGVSTLTYDLGVSEISPNATVLVPSADKLNELSNYAADTDLVVMYDGLEIERFDLSVE